MKLDLQNNDLQIEIEAKNYSILALKKSLKEMDIEKSKGSCPTKARTV